MFVVTKTHDAFYSEELFDPEAPRKRGCTAARSQSRPVGGHCERGAGPAEDAVRYFSREMSKKKVVLVAGEQGIGYISQGPMGAWEAA
jgi:hypothetical protein